MDGGEKCEVKDLPVVCGGWSAEKPADPEVQVLCDSVKQEFLQKSGVNATKFEAVKCKHQAVAGTNHFVMVWLGEDQYCHLSIYEPLRFAREKPRLKGFKIGKTKDEAIGFF